MILNFDGLHTGDVIMVMPIITSLRRSGIDVKCFVNKVYRPLLRCFDLHYVDTPHGVNMSTFDINEHVTEYWLKHFDVNPIRYVIESVPVQSYTLISPDSRDTQKRLSNKFWKDLVIRLKSEGHIIKMIGPSDAIEYNKQLALDVIDETGNTDINNLYNQLISARNVITTDTAMSHLSDALNDSTITVFRRMNYEKYKPYWNPQIAVTVDDVMRYIK